MRILAAAIGTDVSLARSLLPFLLSFPALG
jgi:hypothetical protein